MNLIDTHAHLYWEDYKEDFDQVITRALDAGVKTIINVGVDIEKSKEAVQVSKKLALSGVEGYSTIGIHPHEAAKFSSDQIYKLEEIYKSAPDKVVAVGECGLDYLEIDEKMKDMQKKLFQAQIDLAKKLHLPLIVHCRDDRSKNPENSEAWDKVINMVKSHFGILHCYSGLPKTTKRALEKTNFLISFAGNLTYPKNEYLRKTVRQIPSNRIILETDCPFLPPQSKRGKRNEPANILEIAQFVADLKEVSLEKVATQTSANVTGVFAL